MPCLWALLPISAKKLTGNIFVNNREQLRQNRELFGAQADGIPDKIPTNVPTNRAQISGVFGQVGDRFGWKAEIPNTYRSTKWSIEK